MQKQVQTFTKQIGNVILVCLNKKGKLNFKFKFEFIHLLLRQMIMQFKSKL
jgi:hypothetical protein